jgi:hypothetical protein
VTQPTYVDSAGAGDACSPLPIRALASAAYDRPLGMPGLPESQVHRAAFLVREAPLRPSAAGEGDPW